MTFFDCVIALRLFGPARKRAEEKERGAFPLSAVLSECAVLNGVASGSASVSDSASAARAEHASKVFSGKRKRAASKETKVTKARTLGNPSADFVEILPFHDRDICGKLIGKGGGMSIVVRVVMFLLLQRSLVAFLD